MIAYTKDKEYASLSTALNCVVSALEGGSVHRTANKLRVSPILL